MRLRLDDRARRRVARCVLFTLLGAAMAALTLVVWVVWPPPPEMRVAGGVPSVTLLDRSGQPLRTTRSPDGERGGWIALADVDPDILRAFLAMEDESYFDHPGVELRSVARAARDNLVAGRVVSGASTITMQTARLLDPVPRDWLGKLRQALWALRLEAHLDKQEILELYLNRIPLGQGTVGVDAAARLYFDASAVAVSLGQAATLAGLAHAPSRDNPFSDPPRAIDRRDVVLGRLGRLGYATPGEIWAARAEPISVRRQQQPFLAAHFTTRALRWAESDGETLDGEWRTTLDLALQAALEAEVRHTVDVLAEQRVRQAAAVVIENRTGDILAWVGSPDFWSDSAGQVDMVVSRRQPGSALKPFLYGLAFDRGYTPASILPDVPTTYPTPLADYRPRNYDRRFHGPVRARDALASSHNVPAVELLDRVGIGAFYDVLRQAGFESLDRPADHYGLGLALGNGDVTLLELANAYRALRNGGVWTPLRWRMDGSAQPGVLFDPGTAAGRPGEPPPRAREADVETTTRIDREDGSANGEGMVDGGDDPGTEGSSPFTTAAPSEQLDESHDLGSAGRLASRGSVPRARRLMSAGAAVLVLDILADPVARIPGFGRRTPFDFPFPVAVKTGTSRRFTDNWAVGVTGEFTVAVWVGNFSGEPMAAVSGVSGAGPLLRRAILVAALHYSPSHLPRPESIGAIARKVCLLSGRLAGPNCPHRQEWFLPGSEPREECDWHRQGLIVLPAEYAEWLPASDLAGRAIIAGSEPGLPAAGGVARAGFRIASPQDGDRYAPPIGVAARYATISLRAVGGPLPVRWWVDGDEVTAPRWALRPGAHTITAEAADGERDEVRIYVQDSDGSARANGEPGGP